MHLPAIIGVTEQGRKVLVAVEDGRRESVASWQSCSRGDVSVRLQASGRRGLHEILGRVE